jgi:hypothetical protein
MAGAACLLVTGWASASLAADTSTAGYVILAQAADDSNGSSDNSGKTPEAIGGVKGPMSIDDIDVNNPFGDIVFDRSQEMAQIDQGFSEAQRQEMHQRCDLIASNKGKFADADVPGWCSSYNSYYSETYPAQ